jgi:hypothetical protein
MSGESDEQQHDRRIGVSQGLPAAAPAAIALAAVLETAPIRFVHVGSASGPDITLPGAALRSSAITLTGSGIGSIPLDRIVKSIGE